jgi:hypothetical protein
MKYLKNILLAILLSISITGLALAHSGQSYDPQDYFAPMTIPVFNNSGGTLDAGDVVVWQIGSSTGDNDAYVTTTTTASTSIVAGVVYPASITDQRSGSIAIYGVVDCDILAGSTGNVANGGPLCTSGTAGDSIPCPDDQDGFAIAAADSNGATTVKCFLNP